jgi:SAM-dependent methyltransferase
MSETANEQKKLWDGLGGQAWVEAQEVLDRLFKPFEDLLVESVSAKSPNAVPDVGCGTGSTTLAIARLLGAKGSCVGIDISEPMTAAAQSRAEREDLPARFICADAQRYALDPVSIDMIVSRFGVMFFDDPVAAFANLRRAARDTAALRLITWRSAAENPFMTTAERAAAPLLPDLPVRRADGPGQFAFADAQRVSNILTGGGWTHVDLQPIDVGCTLLESELVRYTTQLGPVGRMLQGADDTTRARVIDTIRPAFDSYVRGSEVEFTAACWVVSAQARSA